MKSDGWVLTLDADFRQQQQLDWSVWSTMYPWSPQVINNEQESARYSWAATLRHCPPKQPLTRCLRLCPPVRYYMPDAFKFHSAGLDFVLDSTTICPQPFSSGAMTTNNKWTQSQRQPDSLQHTGSRSSSVRLMQPLSLSLSLLR